MRRAGPRARPERRGATRRSRRAEPPPAPRETQGPCCCCWLTGARSSVGGFDVFLTARAGRRSCARATSRAAWLISAALVGMVGQTSSRIASRGPARARAVMHALERGTSPFGWMHPLALCGIVRSGDSARTAPSHSLSLAAPSSRICRSLVGGRALGKATKATGFSGAAGAVSSGPAAAVSAAAGLTTSTSTVGPVGAAGAGVDGGAAGTTTVVWAGLVGAVGADSVGAAQAPVGVAPSDVPLAGVSPVQDAGVSSSVAGHALASAAVPSVAASAAGLSSSVGGLVQPAGSLSAGSSSDGSVAAGVVSAGSVSAGFVSAGSAAGVLDACFLRRASLARVGRGRRRRRLGRLLGLERHGCFGLELDRRAAGLAATGLGCRSGCGSSGGGRRRHRGRRRPLCDGVRRGWVALARPCGLGEAESGDEGCRQRQEQNARPLPAPPILQSLPLCRQLPLPVERRLSFLPQFQSQSKPWP